MIISKAFTAFVCVYVRVVCVCVCVHICVVCVYVYICVVCVMCMCAVYCVVYVCTHAHTSRGMSVEVRGSQFSPSLGRSQDGTRRLRLNRKILYPFTLLAQHPFCLLFLFLFPTGLSEAEASFLCEFECIGTARSEPARGASSWEVTSVPMVRVKNRDMTQ